MLIERLLADVAGEPVRVVGTESLGGDFAPVERLTLATGRTVIKKWRRRDGTGWGFDPGNLRREYAGLRTLTDLGLNLCPRVLAGSDAEDTLILSDLGPGPSVVDLLHGDDPAAAERALQDVARALGRIHAAAADSEELFDSHYSSFASGELPSDRPIPALDDPLGEWSEVVGVFEELGFPSPRGSDLQDWLEAYSDGRFRTFVHNDLNPQNAVCVDGGIAFVDFEGMGYRNIGIDAEFLRFPFQNYALFVPEGIRAEMERLYRAELADTLWSDESTFRSFMAVGLAFFTIRICCGIRRVADEDQSAPSARRRRVRLSGLVVATLDALTEAGAFPGLAAWLGDVLAEAQARWREVTGPPEYFPAFR
ncbi:MAG TPA: phosphotransferase [Mycobacteriales bacterium]|nr:phosphotransferase [Mycobacteriales bacterium]